MSKNANPAVAATATAGGLTTKHIILILGSLLIVAGGVVAAIILTRQPPVQQLPAAERSVMPVVNEENMADVKANIHEKVAMGMFETHMNMDWTFPDGESPSSDAIMGNSPNNNFPFWFELLVQDEVLYTSDLLPVGSQVKEIILGKDLDPGTYSGTVRINMIDHDGNPIDGNMTFRVNLLIQG